MRSPVTAGKCRNLAFLRRFWFGADTSYLTMMEFFVSCRGIPRVHQLRKTATFSSRSKIGRGWLTTVVGYVMYWRVFLWDQPPKWTVGVAFRALALSQGLAYILDQVEYRHLGVTPSLDVVWFNSAQRRQNAVSQRRAILAVCTIHLLFAGFHPVSASLTLL